MFEEAGWKYEDVWQSRRVWSAFLSLLVILAMSFYPDQYALIQQVAVGLAGALGLSSWMMPKE